MNLYSQNKSLSKREHGSSQIFVKEQQISYQEENMQSNQMNSDKQENLRNEGENLEVQKYSKIQESKKNQELSQKNIVAPNKKKLIYKQKHLTKIQKQRMIRQFYKMYDQHQSMQWLLFQKMKTIAHRNNKKNQQDKKLARIHWMNTIKKINSIISQNKIHHQSSSANINPQKSAKCSILMFKQIYHTDFKLMMNNKEKLSTLKDKIERAQKQKYKYEKEQNHNIKAEDKRTCKICNAIFEDGRQLGGHMSKKHPGRSYEYKTKMLVKANKCLQNERRLYFKHLRGQQQKKKYKKCCKNNEIFSQNEQNIDNNTTTKKTVKKTGLIKKANRVKTTKSVQILNCQNRFNKQVEKNQFAIYQQSDDQNQ